jgi:hypothetical protein
VLCLRYASHIALAVASPRALEIHGSECVWLAQDTGSRRPAWPPVLAVRCAPCGAAGIMSPAALGPNVRQGGGRGPVVTHGQCGRDWRRSGQKESALFPLEVPLATLLTWGSRVGSTETHSGRGDGGPASAQEEEGHLLFPPLRHRVDDATPGATCVPAWRPSTPRPVVVGWLLFTWEGPGISASPAPCSDMRTCSLMPLAGL